MLNYLSSTPFFKLFNILFILLIIWRTLWSTSVTEHFEPPTWRQSISFIIPVKIVSVCSFIFSFRTSNYDKLKHVEGLLWKVDYSWTCSKDTSQQQIFNIWFVTLHQTLVNPQVTFSHASAHSKILNDNICKQINNKVEQTKSTLYGFFSPYFLQSTSLYFIFCQEGNFGVKSIM